MPLYKKSMYTVGVEIENYGEPLLGLFHTITKAFVIVPGDAWEKLDTNIVPGADEGLDTLCGQGFLVEDGVDEFQVFEAWKQQHVHDFSIIKSKNLVTRKCNNRCTYCIVDPEAEEMSEETARAIDSFYLGRIEKKKPGKVRDDFLGGEPLLNTKVIYESTARRFYFCRGREIDYSFAITTNGTLLTPSIISRLKETGLSKIRVSMAGPAPIHDLLRPSINNGKTYDKIIGNLQKISHLIPVLIECQYDSSCDDYLRIPEMMDDFARHGINTKEIAFTPILQKRGDNKYDNGMGNPEKYDFLKKEAMKRGYPMNEDAPQNGCLADFRSAFVFDTKGNLLPCPSVQNGEFAYGNVKTGADFVAESQILKRNLDEKCHKCELVPVCTGGCRLQALLHKKDFSGADCQYQSYRYHLENYIRNKAKETLEEGGSRETPKAA